MSIPLRTAHIFAFERMTLTLDEWAILLGNWSGCQDGDNRQIFTMRCKPLKCNDQR
jgi:hypothetical protein